MEGYKKFLITIFIILLLIPSFTYANIETSNSPNDKDLQTINPVNNTTDEVNLALAPAGADYLSMEITWLPTGSSTIYLGTVDADGLTRNYNNNERIILDASTHVYLYVRSTGDFTNDDGDIIPISNFKYSGYNGLDNPVVTPRSFTTDPAPGQFISRMKKQRTETYANFSLTVPVGSAGGTYRTTIIHTAIAQ